MTRSTRRATYQDVLDAPAHRVAEIVGSTKIRGVKVADIDG